MVDRRRVPNAVFTSIRASRDVLRDWEAFASSPTLSAGFNDVTPRIIVSPRAVDVGAFVMASTGSSGIGCGDNTGLTLEVKPLPLGCDEAKSFVEISQRGLVLFIKIGEVFNFDGLTVHHLNLALSI
jgi:hypothetical protein